MNQLFAGGVSSSVVVGRDGSQGWTLANLWHAAGTLAADLPAPKPGAHVLLVCKHDAWAFLAALLGAWRRGHTVALPPDHHRDTTMSLLARSDVVALLHDTGAGLPIAIGRALEPSDGQVTPTALPSIPDHAVTFLERQSDGSFEPRPIQRSELLAAAQSSPVMQVARESLVATAVLPCLPEGLYAVLAVLLRQACLVRAMGPTALADVLDRRSDTDHDEQRPTVVIAAPSQQRQLSRRNGFATSKPQWIRLPSGDDHVTDTTLDALEQTLAEVPGVLDVGVLSRIDTRPNGDLLVAFVPAVASDPSVTAAIEQALPADRRTTVREVAEVDRDARGLLDRRLWMQRFGLDAHGETLARELIWESEQDRIADDPPTWRFRVRVPLNYAGYTGHFAGYPVMAGVVQLHELVMPCLARARPDLGGPKQFQRLKFTGRIAPGDTLTVIVRAATQPATFEFEIRRGQTTCSAGRVSFDAPPELP